MNLRQQEYVGLLSYAKLRKSFKYLAVLLVPPRVIVAGEMSGRIKGRGKVLIKEGAVFAGAINAEALIVQGIVVGDINVKKLVIKNEGQLYYKNANHNFLRTSRNGTFLSISEIREQLDVRNNNLTVFLDRLIKNAEEFLSNRGKSGAATNEQESAALVHSVEPRGHWETPFDQENAACIHTKASIDRDAVAHVHSNMATPGQEDATPVHQDTTIEQGETALVYRDAAVKQEKTSLAYQDTTTKSEENALTQLDAKSMQKETPLEPQEVPDNSPLKGAEKGDGHEIDINITNKRQGIYFINTY
jgi:cytoskeletal protein CcmA (bactofilin family)